MEALCALALAGVLAGVAASALGSARRAFAGTERSARDSRVAREAVSITAGMLRDADSLQVLGDTAVAAAFLIASGAACDIEPSRRAVLLPPATLAGGAPFSQVAQPPEFGDLVALLATDSVGKGGYWWAGIVDSVGSRSAASPCGPMEGWTSPADAVAERTRLVFTSALPADVRTGAPVRVLRRGRLALYGSGGEWMLGWRRCTSDGATCGVIQPVAGPLMSPSQGGLRLRLDGFALTIAARAAPSGRLDSSVVALRRAAP